MRISICRLVNGLKFFIVDYVGLRGKTQVKKYPSTICASSWGLVKTICQCNRWAVTGLWPPAGSPEWLHQDKCPVMENLALRGCCCLLLNNLPGSHYKCLTACIWTDEMTMHAKKSHTDVTCQRQLTTVFNHINDKFWTKLNVGAITLPDVATFEFFDTVLMDTIPFQYIGWTTGCSKCLVKAWFYKNWVITVPNNLHAGHKKSSDNKMIKHKIINFRLPSLNLSSSCSFVQLHEVITKNPLFFRALFRAWT